MSSWALVSKGLDFIPKKRISTVNDGNLVTVQLSGGIGNRIFQILTGISYARRVNKKFVLCEKFMLNNEHFGRRRTLEFILQLFPSVKIFRGSAIWKQYRDPSSNFEFNEIPDIDGSIVLIGYFQNEQYLLDRNSFEIPKPIEMKFSVERDFNHSYFVHFRFGDYKDSQFHIDLKSYYKEAIKRVKDCDKEARFLIFSDEINLINLALYELDPNSLIVPSNINSWESLYLMSLCNGGICANSTFSWFGARAIKGTGPIFMPDKWIKDVNSNPVPYWATKIDL